jgi:hemoglobin-like flavoprotein
MINDRRPGDTALSTQDLIISSLETVAENLGDITPRVYQKYFTAEPEAEELMSHLDPLSKGKMMEEVMRLLMVEDFSGEDQYLKFEMNTHAGAYSVRAQMYRNLLTAVFETVEEGLDEPMSADTRNAWEHRLGELLEALDRHIPA